MVRNYFKIMLRNFLRRKGFTLINLFGLATGMAICLLLVLYIQSQLGYDTYQQQGDQIYRIALERKYPGRSAFLGNIPRSIGQAIKNEFPEVKEVIRVVSPNYDGDKIKVGEKVFTDKTVMSADPNFFSVFTGEFLQGDAGSALQKPNSAVLNETTAIKYFGSAENAMGKQIIINDLEKSIVSGVIRDWPEKSQFLFNILLTTSGDNPFNTQQEYVYFGPFCYILLNKNASAAALEAKLPFIVDKYVSPKIEGLFGEPYDKFVAEGNGYHYFLQPLKKVHLTSELERELRPVGSMKTLLIFGAIAAFILFLACVNFINLSTALSVERAKEVGIRKTFGSRKRELIGQFLSESVLFSLLSLLLALFMVSIFTPMLRNISGVELSFTYFLNPPTLLAVLGFSLIVGIVAGLYPAFVLSAFDPIMVLKGKFRSNSRGIALRNGLVIFQFAISVILIICTIVVNMQMQYMLGDKLGFKKDHIISIEGVWQLNNLGHRNGDRVTDFRKSFVDEILKVPGVEDITECDQLPGNDESGGGATWIAKDNNASRTDRMMQADYNYTRLLDLQLKEGRFFSKEFATDSLSVVLNEKAVEDFGLKNPIGAQLICKESGLNPQDGKSPYIFTVIGVLKDFHYQSLHKKIAPLIFINSNKFGWGTVGVKIGGDHFKTTLADIENTWKRMDAKHDFKFTFLDENVAAQYKAEQTEQKLFTIFSFLAIVIACIGLFGLAGYSTIQRTKEISIRKVLGAMPANIFMILSKDFLILVVVASLIAFPLAWWAMYKWLQNFSYRVDISWWIFLIAGALSLLIAMITISYQAVKAAIVNPVTSLKAE